MWSYEKEVNTEPPSMIRPQHYLQHLSMCVYRTKIRPGCPLSDSNSNAQEFLVDIPVSNFISYDACYNTNMATDICFETLHPSIWKKNLNLHNMWKSTVKWLDSFYNTDFKQLFQHWNLCHKTNKWTCIKRVYSHILISHNILHTYVFWFCYVSLNIPLMQGYWTIYVRDTSATAVENLVSYFKIYSLLRPWRIQRDGKNQSDAASPSVFYRRLRCPYK